MSSEGWISILRRRVGTERAGIAGAKMLTKVGDGRNLDCKSEYVSRPVPNGRPLKSIERSRALRIRSEVQRGKSLRQISRDHGIDRRTLTRWIDSGRLDLMATG